MSNTELEREAVVGAIQELADDLGKRPSMREMETQGPYSQNYIEKRFGSWNEAVEAAGFNAHTVNKPVSKETLIEEMQALAAELGRTPTQEDITEKTDRAFATWVRKFGSWNEGVRAAGLEVNHEIGIEKVELECDNPVCENTVEKYESKIDNSEYHFCSQACHYEHNKIRYKGENNPVSTLDEVECANCGKTLKRAKWERERYPNQFCDYQCAAEWRQEHVSGENHPQWVEYPTLECEICGKPFTVRPAKAEVQRFCSRACRATWQSEAYQGEGNPLWKGLKTSYMGANWPEQRMKAVIRDQARCQHPGCETTDPAMIEKEGRGLDVHHLTPREEFIEGDELDWKRANRLENLITLCSVHHKVWEHSNNSPLKNN